MSMGGIEWVDDPEYCVEEETLAEFVDEGFRDGDTEKYLCGGCGHGKILIGAIDTCGCRLCEDDMQPVSAINSSCLLLIEYGSIGENPKSGVGGFLTSRYGFCCFHCACEQFELQDVINVLSPDDIMPGVQLRDIL
jgi:hypothetical protein